MDVTATIQLSNPERAELAPHHRVHASGVASEARRARNGRSRRVRFDASWLEGVSKRVGHPRVQAIPAHQRDLRQSHLVGAGIYGGWLVVGWIGRDSKRHVIGRCADRIRRQAKDINAALREGGRGRTAICIGEDHRAWPTDFRPGDLKRRTWQTVVTGGALQRRNDLRRGWIGSEDKAPRIRPIETVDAEIPYDLPRGC